MVENPSARKLMEFLDSRAISIRALARVAGVSEAGIRNFRDMKDRTPNHSTKFAIVSALHLLTQEKIDPDILFDGNLNENLSDLVNRDENPAFSNLLRKKKASPTSLAHDTRLNIDIVLQLLKGQRIDQRDAQRIANYLNVSVEALFEREAVTEHRELTSPSHAPAPPHLSSFAGMSSCEIAAYSEAFASTGELWSTEAESAVDSVLDLDSALGESTSLRRLYYLLHLKEQAEKQISALTKPRLAELVKTELPKLALAEHGGNVESTDGTIYVRFASQKKRYLEIGVPSLSIFSRKQGLASQEIEWTGLVLEGIEFCAPLFDEIVLNDPLLNVDLRLTLLDRGWIPTGGIAPFKFVRG